MKENSLQEIDCVPLLPEYSTILKKRSSNYLLSGPFFPYYIKLIKHISIGSRNNKANHYRTDRTPLINEAIHTTQRLSTLLAGA